MSSIFFWGHIIRIILHDEKFYIEYDTHNYIIFHYFMIFFISQYYSTESDIGPQLTNSQKQVPSINFFVEFRSLETLWFCGQFCGRRT